MYSAFPGNCSVSYLSFVYGRSLWAELNGEENSLHWKDNTLPLFSIMNLCTKHRVIILNRGSIFAFQWREFSPPLSSAHRLLQCYHIQKRDRRRCNYRGIPPQPPATRVISKWASSPVWRHVVTLHTAVGKNCITFFPFSCEACSLYFLLWLCGTKQGWHPPSEVTSHLPVSTILRYSLLICLLHASYPWMNFIPTSRSGNDA